MQLLQQALAVLITTTAEEKAARQRAEAMAHEREELRLEAEMKHREFEIARMTKWEHAEQERQARMKEMEKDSVERLREAEERRAAETEVREASNKKQLILQTLQKLDDLTDPEAYLVAFETSMAEGDFAEKDWLTILRKLITGKALSVYQELDPAVPYKTFKSTLLEWLGYTDAKARKTVWRSQPSDQLSPRNHLAPIIRGINRLAQTVNDRKGHVFEQFRGALTLYYSAEVCHSLRSKDYDSVQQMVDELEAAWESKSPVE